MRFRARLEHDEACHSDRSEESLESKYSPCSAIENNQRCFASLNMTVASRTDDLPNMSLTRIIEALLFSAHKPLSIQEITAAIRGAESDLAREMPNEFGRVKNAEVAAALEQLKVEYIQQSRAFQLVERAEGWQLATDPGFANWVRQLFPAPKPARLSAPALETLAIIAYRSRSPVRM